jgi:pectate lyase
MVYFILSRHGYDQLVASGGLPNSPLWVSGGVLSVDELSDLYVRGFNINNFHNQIDPGDPEEVDEAVDTIRLHHPGQVVWVEYSHAA